MAKRGRKRKGYFYEEQEQAVVDYISTKDKQVKNKIYDEILKPAFTKMVESIIRRYKLFLPNEEFDETFYDTISFLMTKIEKFDPSKGRAYSYCGTICRNFLLLKLEKHQKSRERQESYEVIHETLTDTVRYAEESASNEHAEFLSKLIDETCKEIQRIIDSEDIPLTEDEEKVGLALINIFQNWDEVFMEMGMDEGSNKFNKSSILLYLKETTRLKTPAIRNNMKKYKSAYYAIKKLMLEMY